jgi:ubiquinone biosynthesis protein COQ4
MRIMSIRLFDAARAIRNVLADPDDTQHVFEVIDALQGPTLHRIRAKLQRSPQGRHLLATRPQILPLLCDREMLAVLPEGSLGRAYLAFVNAEGITADGLVEASLASCRDDADVELAWIKDWLRDTHDLWHTVLGYHGDLVGEAALLAFSHRETGNWGVGAIATVAWFKLGRVTDKSIHARETIWDGRRLAKQTGWFIDVPWHEWLERPLQEVRRDLRVTTPVKYTPVRSSEVEMALVG